MYLIFSLSVLLSFLNIGRTSACFNAVGKEELDNKLLKLGKTYNDTRSLFSVIVLIVMSVACQAFLGFEFLTPFKVSFRQTNLKLNFWLFILIILFLINVILRWPLYFSNASFTGSAKSYTDGSLMEQFSGNDKILAMFTSLNFPAICTWVDILTHYQSNW